MRVNISPIQDASIYSESVNRNTGLDEILEVGKSDIGNYPKRALLQFDLSQFAAVPPNATYELRLSTAYASLLQVNQGIEVRNVTAPWTEGSGYWGQDTYQVADGVTWATQPTTGSLVTSSSIGNPVKEMTFDVTSIIQAQLSGSSSGLLVRFPLADETNVTNKGFIRFFSKDTHTIHTPILTAKWNDQVYLTGSLGSYPSTGLLVTPATLKPVYTVGEVARVNLSVRPATPTKSFTTQFTQYLGNNYLPTSSYYSIVDDYAGKVIVPFDDSSRISCDATSSYFTFRVDNMYPLRYYRVKIRVDHDGLSEVFDAGYTFKVAQ